MAPKKPALAKPDIGSLLASAALPEKTVEVCLRGDLVAQVEDLERDLRDLRTDARTMADRGKAQQLAEQIEAVRQEMQASAVVFRFRGLNRKAWADLFTANPPREGNAVDKALGFNADTFYPALIRVCLIDPVLDDEEWERLDALLSSKQYDDLAEAALTVSRRKVDVPFSFAASATLSTSGETSK